MKEEATEEKIWRFLKTNWQDKALILVIILFLVLQLGILNQLKQLPGPIFGGDFYYHLGMMNHINDGGSIFENSQAIGGYPWAPPLYHIIVIGISKIFKISLIKAILYSNILFTSLIGIVSYILGIVFLKKRTLALTLATYNISILTLYYHYHAIRNITGIFFILMLFYAYQKKDMKLNIITGISYGLVHLSHASAGMGASALLVMYFLYVTFFQYFKLKSIDFKNIKKNLKYNLIYFSIVFGIGVLIGLLYWFIPIFVLHFATPNKLQEYNFIRIDTLFLQLKLMYDNISHMFIPRFGNFLIGIFIILFDIGFLAIIFIKRKSEEIKYLLLLFVTTVIGISHPVITQNLFGFNLTPSAFGFPQIVFERVVPFFGLLIVLNTLSNKINILKKYKEMLLVVFFIFVLSIGVFGYTASKTSSPYFENGKQPIPEYMEEISVWIKENTEVRDVFLTSNEDAFMLNALTGRKILASRRGHFGMYVEVDQRYLDAALILHGNDDQKREELLEKNNVKYVFWHFRWLQNEFQFNEQGQIAGISDPLLLIDKDNYEDILIKYNVSYQKMHTWLDPALRGEKYPQYDTLLVQPQFNTTHPWSNELDKYLKLEKTFYVQTGPGQNFEAAKIYSINI